MTSSFATKQFFGTWKIVFCCTALVRRCNSSLCENNFSGSEKLFFSQCLWQEMEYHAQVQNEFSCTSLCGIGDQSCKSPLSPENQWSNELDKKTIFQVPKNCLFFFFCSFLCVNRPLVEWNRALRKNNFLEPEKLFFQHMLAQLAALSKSFKINIWEPQQLFCSNNLMTMEHFGDPILNLLTPPRGWPR